MRDVVPVISQHVVARPEQGGVLLFEIESDEMYFAPDAVYELLKLCDGSRTVGELEAVVAERTGGRDQPEDRRRVEACLEELATRSLIDLWD